MSPAAPEPRWLDEDQQRSWRALVVGSTLLMAMLGGLIAAKVVRADNAPRTAALCGLVAFLATGKHELRGAVRPVGHRSRRDAQGDRRGDVAVLAGDPALLRQLHD